MIRKAKLHDTRAIKALIDHFAKQQPLLPRSMANIISNIRDFTVFEKKTKRYLDALHSSSAGLT